MFRNTKNLLRILSHYQGVKLIKPQQAFQSYNFTSNLSKLCSNKNQNASSSLLFGFNPRFDFSSFTKLPMPALSPTMSKGNILKWLIKEGDEIKPGDILCEIETDKATVGFENQEEGYLAKIVLPENSKNVAIGQVIAIIVDEKADIAKYKDYVPEDAAPAQQQQKEPSQAKQQQKQAEQTSNVSAPETKKQKQPQQAASGGAGDRIQISPLAKKFAEQHGINIEQLRGRGTGEGGRITREDVNKILSEQGQQQAQPQQQAAQVQKQGKAQPQKQPFQATVAGNEFVDQQVSNIRQVIADRLLESKTTIPHYYLTASVEMDTVLKIRQELNKDGKQKISVNDLIIKASSLACRDIPECNSSWLGDKIRTYKNCDISVAVSTDNGLITPIIFAANQKGLIEISQNMKELAQKARSNSLKPNEFIGGTFTISNLGMFGIDQFAAIINPPQAAILAIGKTEKKVVPSTNKENPFRTADVMNVTLSCDHRVVDGAVGAKWLQVFKDYLENPSKMLL